MERDNLDLTAAMFSESQARVIVSVGREDDVEFQALCEARGVPVLRIGVTDKENQAVDIQGVAKLGLGEVRVLGLVRYPASTNPYPRIPELVHHPGPVAKHLERQPREKTRRTKA